MKERILPLKKSATAWCKANKVFTGVLLVQALIVLYFVARLFAPQTVISVDLTSFTEAWATETVTYSEDGLTIYNEAEEACVTILNAPSFELPAGAYLLSASYQSALDPTQPDGDISQYSVAIYHVNIPDSTGEAENNLILLLRNSTQSLEGRIWSTGAENDDSLMLYYTGEGYTNIESITIEEQVIWRWLQLAGVCLVLLACNLLYYLFFANVPQEKLALHAKHAARAKTGLMLCAITVVACIPFFADFMYLGDDTSFHLTRIVSVATELAGGQFPVRMMTEMVNGYGYANAQFYCDIFLYIPAILYNCMMPLRTAYQIYAIGTTFATVSIAYYCFVKISQDKGIAMVGASLYTLAMYRLTNVYTRGALGEYSAMVFFPLVVLGMWNIYKAKKPCYGDWLPLALGMAGIIQCHVLSVEMVVVFLAMVCLLLCKQTIARIPQFAMAVLLCAGLAAWFWVPFLDSLRTMDLITEDTIVTEIQSSGIKLFQLFAFTGYELGTAQMPLMLGWGLLVGVCIAVYYMSQRVALNLQNQWTYKALCMATLLGVIASVFTLDSFPWTALSYDIHPKLADIINTIQFPWRYLAIASICFVLVSVLALMLIKQYHKQFYYASVSVMLVLTLLSMGMFYSSFVNSANHYEKDDLDVSELIIDWCHYMLEGTIEGEHYVSLVTTSSDELVVVSYGKEDGVATVSLENTSNEAQTVSLPIWNYPNYHASDAENGTVYGITTGENNRIDITVAAGYSGTIAVQYVSPWYWHVAEFITLCSWGFVAFMAYRQRKQSHALQAAEEDCEER